LPTAYLPPSQLRGARRECDKLKRSAAGLLTLPENSVVAFETTAVSRLESTL
jgi:hypothetical protein